MVAPNTNEIYKYLHRSGLVWLMIGLLNIIVSYWLITLPLTEPWLERLYSSATQLYGLGFGMAGYLLGLAGYLKRKSFVTTATRPLSFGDALSLLRHQATLWAVVAGIALGLQLLVPVLIGNAVWDNRLSTAFGFVLALGSLLAGQLFGLAAYLRKGKCYQHSS
jgi:hypothetical protein